MFGLLKKVIAGEANPVELIQGEQKPSIILVDLVCTKILLNLDNIAFEEKLFGDRDGVISFNWKVDEIVVGGTKTVVVHDRYDREAGKHYYDRKPKLDHFSIKPFLKVHGERHELTDSEQERLWETMLKAGRMKVKLDIERAEFRRQRLAVEAIGNMGDRESDVVKRARELSEQALLRLSPPPKSEDELLQDRINNIVDDVEVDSKKKK